MNTEPELIRMKQKIESAGKNIDALLASARSPLKFNTLLDAAMQQMEAACIELRSIAETIRPKETSVTENLKTAKTIYGSVTLTEENWVHIKLNTLLPHYKVLGGTRYIADSLTRLLDRYGQTLPCFEKAFVGIVEHCSAECCEAFDSDNKGFKAVINTLKGRLFPDDNQFELSLGLFTENDSTNCCHIYVLPESDAAKFVYLKGKGGV